MTGKTTPRRPTFFSSTSMPLLPLVKPRPEEPDLRATASSPLIVRRQSPSTLHRPYGERRMVRLIEENLDRAHDILFDELHVNEADVGSSNKYIKKITRNIELIESWHALQTILSIAPEQAPFILAEPHIQRLLEDDARFVYLDDLLACSAHTLPVILNNAGLKFLHYRIRDEGKCFFSLQRGVSSPDVLAAMGEIYYTGKIFDRKNPGYGIRCLQQAASQGDDRAIEQLGQYYLQLGKAFLTPENCQILANLQDVQSDDPHSDFAKQLLDAADRHELEHWVTPRFTAAADYLQQINADCSAFAEAQYLLGDIVYHHQLPPQQAEDAVFEPLSDYHQRIKSYLATAIIHFAIGKQFTEQAEKFQQHALARFFKDEDSVSIQRFLEDFCQQPLLPANKNSLLNLGCNLYKLLPKRELSETEERYYQRIKPQVRVALYCLIQGGCEASAQQRKLTTAIVDHLLNCYYHPQIKLPLPTLERIDLLGEFLVEWANPQHQPCF